MIIGGIRRNKNKNNDNQQSKKNNKASILARNVNAGNYKKKYMKKHKNFKVLDIVYKV